MTWYKDSGLELRKSQTMLSKAKRTDPLDGLRFDASVRLNALLVPKVACRVTLLALSRE